MARANGVEELLPPTSKGTAARIQKRAEHGLRVKGTGVGQRVKGKEWERTMKGKLERRRVAMEGMSKMIQDWKQVRWLDLCRDSFANRLDREDTVVDGRSFRDSALFASDFEEFLGFSIAFFDESVGFSIDA